MGTRKVPKLYLTMAKRSSMFPAIILIGSCRNEDDFGAAHLETPSGETWVKANLQWQRTSSTNIFNLPKKNGVLAETICHIFVLKRYRGL